MIQKKKLINYFFVFVFSIENIYYNINYKKKKKTIDY